MKKHSNIFVFIGLLSLVCLLCLYVRAFDNSSVSDSDAVGNRFKLVWMDDFKGSDLDYSKWSKIKRLYQAPWLKYMSSNPSLYNVETDVCACMHAETGIWNRQILQKSLPVVFLLKIRLP